MPSRHSPPRIWLLTDERQGEKVWAALARLPRGAGVVVRHRSIEARERQMLVARVRGLARARGLVVVLAGGMADARRQRASGAHGTQPGRVAGCLLTRSVHDLREMAAAQRARADLIFVSPVRSTRSHPDAPPMGLTQFGLLLRRARVPVVALGGIDSRRAAALPPGAYGWAAIDAWSRPAARAPLPPPQKRKAVPR